MNIENIMTVGVAGTGSMGVGIMQIAAQAGFQVKAVDVSQEAWNKALKAITKSLERMLSKEKITEDHMKEALSRISFSTDIESLKDVPFVFEAIFENLDVKKGFYEKLDAISRASAPAR